MIRAPSGTSSLIRSVYVEPPNPHPRLVCPKPGHPTQAHLPSTFARTSRSGLTFRQRIRAPLDQAPEDGEA